MARRPTLEFWYEFASPYSYLAASRIEAAAGEAGVGVRWRPFLLGPIFAAQGWTTSPMVLYPARGRHQWRDLEREAGRLGLPPLRRPDPFPPHSLLAARVATLGADEPWIGAFTAAIYRTAFAEGRPIGDPATVQAVLREVGLTADLLKAAGGDANKTRLRAIGEEARSRGLFGAPTFITEDGELFWGNDRLDRALAWAAGERPRGGG